MSKIAALQELLQVMDLSYSFPGSGKAAPILSSVSFDLSGSKLVAITGPSGCGKTTLLRLISGLLEPCSGSIRIHGTDDRSAKIGIMFQDHKLIPWMKVEENCLFGHSAENIDSKEFDEVIDVLGLRDCLRRYPNSLSGGQKERVAIGRALLGQPDLLLLDEPLGSTDFVHRLEIEDYIFKRIRNSKAGAVVVTHDLDQALANGDEVVILPSSLRKKIPVVLQVPADLRRAKPSQARLIPQMGAEMRKLIVEYEALL